MGQQQLLLLILASIIVGVAVLIGVNMFQENAAQANMDAVTQDCLTFAARAQAYYRRPASMGGGGQTFSNITWATLNYTDDGSGNLKNDNGSYKITGNGTDCTITGDGKEIMPGQTKALQVEVKVTSNGVTVKQQTQS